MEAAIEQARAAIEAGGTREELRRSCRPAARATRSTARCGSSNCALPGRPSGRSQGCRARARASPPSPFPPTIPRTIAAQARTARSRARNQDQARGRVRGRCRARAPGPRRRAPTSGSRSMPTRALMRADLDRLGRAACRDRRIAARTAGRARRGGRTRRLALARSRSPPTKASSIWPNSQPRHRAFRRHQHQAR